MTTSESQSNSNQPLSLPPLIPTTESAPALVLRHKVYKNPPRKLPLLPTITGVWKLSFLSHKLTFRAEAEQCKINLRLRLH